MRRRRFITASGAILTTSMAGCVGNIPLVGDESSTDQKGNPEIEDKISIIDTSLQTTDGENTDLVSLYITGEAVNTTEDNIPVVILRANFFDSNGDIIGANAEQIRELDPRETFNFTIAYPNNPDRDPKATEVDTYSINLYESLTGANIEIPDRPTPEPPSQ